ncbi:MAG: cyclic nucleotide-binding domain-containing protein [Anaerolineales bacterium]
MKKIMVIPSYWARPASVGWQPGDGIYDHPTPLDQEGTLARALDSLHILEDKDFSLVVLACATAPDIEAEVEARVREIVRAKDPPVETYVISHAHLANMHALLQQAEADGLTDVLSLTGYSNIRNMCLYIPYILGAEVAVFIDDDEFFDDPNFMAKAGEFVGTRFMGQTIDGVAGYYMNAKGTYYDDVPEEIHWMTYWDRFGSKREAFDKIIPGEPRLKVTPFAFGGCMVIHRALFRTVPFDPRITRGEDTDYVLNARMFGFSFFLDNQLHVQHRPPDGYSPTWRRFREDIFRLLYSRAKIQGQTEEVNMSLVEAEDFDPYPGEFLKETLDDKILKTNLILALDYLTDERVEDAKETIRNIWLANTKAVPKDNPFQAYLEFQRNWTALRKLTARQLSEGMAEIIQAGRIARKSEEQAHLAMQAELRRSNHAEVLSLLSGSALFAGLGKQQLRSLLRICNRELYKQGDVVVKQGSAERNLFVILKGKARISLTTQSEEEVVLADVGAGETFGEASLLMDSSQPPKVTALEPLDVLSFRLESLAGLMTTDSELAARLWHRLAQMLSDRLHNSNMRYLSETREVPDVADDLVETQPLTEAGEPPSPE